MKLFEVDEKTKLPIPTAEARMIVPFKDILRRISKMEGDADGRRKLLNMMELAYIHFNGVYDSRFKLMSDDEKDNAVRTLIGLPTWWQPDDLVKEGIKVYTELQRTESTDLVLEIQRAVKALTSFAKRGNETLPNLGIQDAREVNEFMDILDRIPNTIDKLKKAKEMLIKEQDALAKGKKGRVLNKFEMPD
jgi:hypothetical protein